MLSEVVVWVSLLLAGTAGAGVTINQTPPRVTVTEGGSVQLNCSFRWNSTQPEGKPPSAISWYKGKERTPLCSTSADCNGRFLKNYTAELRWAWTSITITDLKLNETGRYYCQINIFNGETISGEGTEVTVKRHEDPGVILDPIHSNVYPVGFLALPAVVLMLAPVVIIYILRRCRSPDKRSGTEDVGRGGDKSQSIVYAQLNIRKPDSHYPLDQIEQKSVKPGTWDGAISLEERGEGAVVVSALRRQDHGEKPVVLEPLKARERKGEQVVYAAVNVQQLRGRNL